MVAAVCGEIEKAQWGEAQGAEYRGYASGSRYLVSHGGVAEMCILGEPTEGKIVLGHFGSLWLRISTQGNFIHTAFSEGRRDSNSILRMREVLDAVLEWIPTWEDDPDNAYRGAKAIVNVGAIEGGFGWRVSRTPHRTDLFLDVRVPPTKPMTVARGQVLDAGAALRERFPDYGVEAEIYVTAPGCGDRGRPCAGARRSTRATTRCSATPPPRDVTRWFSDASVLTRYGIATVNYGTSSGLLGSKARRESRHRRAREDGRGLRARGDSRVRGGGVSLYVLPPDLPEPVDDGACDHLSGEGCAASSCSTLRGGRSIWPSSAAGLCRSLRLSADGEARRARTGRLGRRFPGARGCTPQSCAFRDHAGRARRARGPRRGTVGAAARGADRGGGAAWPASTR